MMDYVWVLHPAAWSGCQAKRGLRYLICWVCLQTSSCFAETIESLEQLVSSALRSHPAIQAQQAQEQAARAGIESAAWQFFPTPSVTVEKAHAKATDSYYQGDEVVATLRLQQPIWAGGRLAAGKEKAEAGAIVSRASLEEVRQQLALRVVQAYGDWLSAHLKTRALEKNLATHIRLRDQVQRRIAQGASANSDLTLAISRLMSVEAEVSQARSQKDIARERLELLLGRRIDSTALAMAEAVPRTLNSDRQALLDHAMTVNPSAQKAQGQAKMQEAVIAERRADLSPEVYLRAERQYGNYSYHGASPENRLFIGLSSRLGAGLSSLSNVEAAKSQYQAALAEVEVQNRLISEQVLADYVLATSLKSRLEALEVSLDAADKVSESYDRQFLAGRKTWQDVMNAARELAQTEVQLADIRSARVVTTWRLAINAQGVASMFGGGL